MGCGVGNSIWPIVRANQGHQKVYVVGLDVSRTAIALLRAAPEYQRDRVYAAVFDIASKDITSRGGGGGGGGGGEARTFMYDVEGCADVVNFVFFLFV